MDALYHLIVIAAALLGLFRGWRLGLTGQVSSLLGVGFGAVCAHVFAPEASEGAAEVLPMLEGRPGGAYVCAYIGSAAVFAAVYLLFSLLTGVLRNVMEGFGEGLANSLTGSAFGAFRYLLWVGLGYMLLFCVHPSEELRHCVRSDDGNVVSAVMGMAPSIVGCPPLEEYIHLLELDRARTISQALPGAGNYTAPHDVITIALPEALPPKDERGPNHICNA